MAETGKRIIRKRSADPLWEAKDDLKRRNWQDQEVIAMLNLMQKHNLLVLSPTDAQIGETLVVPMQKLGYNRTGHQIKLKIKSLRKSYLRCKKGEYEALKEIAFYDLLDTLYCNFEAQNSDSEDCTLDNEESSNIWSESEVRCMLAIIKQADLAQELTVGTFPMKALRQIYKSLQNHRIFKSIDQIRIALTSMRNTYVKYKRSLVNGNLDEVCPYYEQLDNMWKRDYANGHFHMMNEREEFWSEEETIVLLESIKDSGLVDEALKYSDLVAQKIQEALRDTGYSRTKNQIIKKLQNLRQNYILVKQYPLLDDALAKFPFYHRYESVFGSGIRIIDEETTVMVSDVDKQEFEDLIVLEKKKHIRGFQWQEDETSTLLDLIDELHMEPIFSGRMTLESVSKLAKPLEERGYVRSVEQIKIKLRGLRQQYYRCLRAGCSAKALLECPYFEKMHGFYTKDESVKISPRKRQTKKKDVLMEIVVDEKDQQSYRNGMVKESPLKFLNMKHKAKNMKDYSTELWEPVETIIDEDNEREDTGGIHCEDDHLSDISFEEVHSVDGEVGEKTYEQLPEEKNFIGFNSEPKNTKVDHFYASGEYLDLEFVEVSTNKFSATESGSEEQKQSPKVYVTQAREKLVNTEDQQSRKQVNENIPRGLQSDLLEDCWSGKSTKDVLLHVLKHEELLQQKHHIWLEKQFEIQRKHDCEHRAELLNELRELRRAITSNFERELYQQH